MLKFLIQKLFDSFKSSNMLETFDFCEQSPLLADYVVACITAWVLNSQLISGIPLLHLLCSYSTCFWQKNFAPVNIAQFNNVFFITLIC
jgi:hypothetical protein